ncbi:hypothetical protein DPMN_176267 [Dreissena polymorpha]|uniref:Uncharacterized protein n=1 Tax=Dreissena polymorpha TaxID=45954 RepID=A0A9D4IJ08_DREPO|nr:hypothetical protein DPMN_176267 [Dreissena polymorpha]
MRQDTLKCFSEVRVKDGLDDKMQEAIGVAPPYEEAHKVGIDVAGRVQGVDSGYTWQA